MTDEITRRTNGAAEATKDYGENMLEMRLLLGRRVRQVLEDDARWEKMTDNNRTELLKLCRDMGWVNGKAKFGKVDHKIRRSSIEEIMKDLSSDGGLARQ